MLPNYYAILGIPPTATLDEIRRAYRKAAFAAHPDRGGSHHLMLRINEAWDVLSNPDKRRAYDLQRASPPAPAARPSRPSGTSSRKPKPKRPPTSRPPTSRPPTFARIAGSLFGRAINTFNHWIDPASSKKRRSSGARVTIVACRYCGQKLRVKPGAVKILCPKCRRWDVLR
jgi:curved DNA-binding protein CbpA